jgi:hypothetical protein
MWEQRGDSDSVTYRTKSLRIIVHKYMGMGDCWFVSCHEIGIDTKTLGEISLDAAKEKGLEVVKKKLHTYIDELG